MYYLKEINKIFKYYNIIKNSLILAVLIIVIDYLNIPTQFIQKDMFLSAIILLLFIILALLDIIFNKRYLLVVAKSINIIDKLLLTNIFSMIFYSIYLIRDFKVYKMIILVILIVAEFILIVCRLIYIRKLLKKQNVKKINTYDLKEFHEQDFSKSDANDLILFNENDVKYDLLNRSIFVNYISDVINQCNPQKSFVFALNGAWGSGKTTILNLVKDTLKSEKIIIIDNFNPWKYNSNETLFRGFYDSITKNENFDFDYSLYKKIYNVYKVLILGNDSIFNKINFDIHFGNNNYSVNELKSIIATYLKLNNKKVVYIIDNIDRLDKEQILIIFKTISTLFDFDNFVYLLSFDEVRVKKIFENELKIDANYLNKIINSSINLPNTNVDTIAEIAIKTIMKLFDYYDVENLEKTRFLEMFSKLSKKFKDIREMKRFLNYISAYIKSNDIQEQVNIGDFVIVQLLKYLNIDLYNTIYTNPTFFVSEDMMLCNMKSTEYFLAEKFNIVAKEFYQKLFDIKENEEYKEILTILFPYISNYNRGYEIKTTIPFNHDSSLYDDSVSNKRIFNGRYFEHYFELTPGKYANLLKEVNDFIKKINYMDNNKKVSLQYQIFLSENISNQKFKLEILNKSLDKIDKNVIEYLMESVYENINKVCINSDGAMMLDTRERCILIISDILNIIDIERAKDKVEDFINKNDNLNDIDKLVYWLNPNKQYQRNLKEEIYQHIKDKFKEKLNYIINNDIDILDYKYGKFSILILKKHDIEEEKIKNYIKSIVNDKNIFRFLRNFINEWIGNKYSYEFNQERLYEFISKEELDKIIESIGYELNFEQQIILDIYNKKITSDEGFDLPIDYNKL